MVQQERQQKVDLKKIYNKSKGPKYDLIAKWIGINKRILDVGCGGAEFSKRLSNNGNQVIGIESSEENYKIAKEKIKAYYGDFSKIEIRGSFDIVLFGDVLEHMSNPEKAIRKAKLLADEIIICIPNFDFWGVIFLRLFGIKKMKSGILDEDHVYFFNKSKIEKMIRENGFEIIDFASPAPKIFPRIYNRVIRLNPSIFGYQFIYKCRINK